MYKLILKYFSVFIFFFVFAAVACAANDGDKFKLVIDAGHGGKDAGAVGKYSKEKNINLKVALAFGSLVEQHCPDVQVIYTRKTDVFVPLQRRADIANNKKADLFISIHTNSLGKGRIAYGTETYTLGMARANENLEVAKRENSVITYETNYKEVYQGFDPNKVESYIIFELMQDKNMKQSVEMARCIQQQYVSHAGRANKGVHQAGFLVLRNTSMPAVLTELGFISTPQEENFLNSEMGVRKLAHSIFNGFQNYRRKYDKDHKIPPITLYAPKAETEEPEEEKQERPQVKERQRKATGTPAAAVPQKSEKQVKAEATEEGAANAKSDRPVFKVQLLVSDRKLKNNDRRLKGIHPVAYYKEKGMYKYTYGSTSDYNEIKRMQKNIKGKMPSTFIVAFVNGEKVNLYEAIKMSKRK